MKLTDKDGETLTMTNPRYIKFAKDMSRAGIPWRWYSGRFMFGEDCPAAVTSDEVSYEDIVRATTVRGLRTDDMGKRTVVYP